MSFINLPNGKNDMMHLFDKLSNQLSNQLSTQLSTQLLNQQQNGGTIEMLPNNKNDMQRLFDKLLTTQQDGGNVGNNFPKTKQDFMELFDALLLDNNEHIGGSGDIADNTNKMSDNSDDDSFEYYESEKKVDEPYFYKGNPMIDIRNYMPIYSSLKKLVANK